MTEPELHLDNYDYLSVNKTYIWFDLNEKYI